MMPAENYIMSKPRGGLWTSTYLGKEYGSDWVQWCIGQGFRIPINGQWKSWILHPKKDANVYVVDSVDDLKRLVSDAIHNSYEHLPGMKGMFDVPDFEKLAKTYDGINLTETGERQTRFTKPNLYGWDCESTSWFTWSFDKVEYLGAVEYRG